VLAGVKGLLASLVGFAALDPACAPWAIAFVDGAARSQSCQIDGTVKHTGSVAGRATTAMKESIARSTDHPPNELGNTF